MISKFKKNIARGNVTELAVVVFLMVILIFVVIFLVNNLSNRDNKNSANSEKKVVNEQQGVVEDKEYDGLKFTSTSLVYEDGMSTLVTTVTNPTDSDYYLDEFHIFVKDEDGNNVINYQNNNGETVNYLVGYVGDSIPAGESMDITTSIDFDISSYAHNISYEAVK